MYNYLLIDVIEEQVMSKVRSKRISLQRIKIQVLHTAQAATSFTPTFGRLIFHGNKAS